jgi:hypothetical protein
MATSFPRRLTDVRAFHHAVATVFVGVLVMGLGCAVVLPGQRAAATEDSDRSEV